MRRALLDFIACPVCLGDLGLRTDASASESAGHPGVNVPNSATHPEITEAGFPNREIKPGHPDSKSVIPDADVAPAEEEIVDGILVCRSCPRWYPVRGRIPELYPDHLRDWERDLEFLKGLEPVIGSELVEKLRHNVAEDRAGALCRTGFPRGKSDDSPAEVSWMPGGQASRPAARRRVPGDPKGEESLVTARSSSPAPEREARSKATVDGEKHEAGLPTKRTAAGAPPDSGLFFKKAEMAIASRVDDPDFFEPGRTAPFNPADPEYTIRSVRRFGVALTLLDLKPGAVVLDAGTGYGWTSEWLSCSGFVPIGLDICRTYLDIGLRRMGPASPHLIAADVENLPLKSGRLDAVLTFDAFHHVPDRRAAMSRFFRALKTPGRIVLAEPGPAHGSEKASIAVMQKYGILEKGLSYRDIVSFCRGLPGASVEQHLVLKLRHGSPASTAGTVLDLIRSAALLLPVRLGRILLPEHTRTRLKKAFRYSDTRFFVVDKRP